MAGATSTFIAEDEGVPPKGGASPLSREASLEGVVGYEQETQGAGCSGEFRRKLGNSEKTEVLCIVI